jgi:hypothetical protein
MTTSKAFYVGCSRCFCPFFFSFFGRGGENRALLLPLDHRIAATIFLNLAGTYLLNPTLHKNRKEKVQCTVKEKHKHSTHIRRT